jgi:hypothetical protein
MPDRPSPYAIAYVPLRRAPARHILDATSPKPPESTDRGGGRLQGLKRLKPKAHRSLKQISRAGAPSTKGFDDAQIDSDLLHRSHEAHNCKGPRYLAGQKGVTRGPCTSPPPEMPRMPDRSYNIEEDSRLTHAYNGYYLEEVTRQRHTLHYEGDLHETTTATTATTSRKLHRMRSPHAIPPLRPPL